MLKLFMHLLNNCIFCVTRIASIHETLKQLYSMPNICWCYSCTSLTVAFSVWHVLRVFMKHLNNCILCLTHVAVFHAHLLRLLIFCVTRTSVIYATLKKCIFLETRIAIIHAALKQLHFMPNACSCYYCTSSTVALSA